MPAVSRRLKSRLVLQEVRLRGLRGDVSGGVKEFL
jgi:hypothetical protein